MTPNNTMFAAVQPLCRVMEQEIETGRKLLQILKMQHKALVKNDVQTLAILEVEGNSVLAHQLKLGQQREEIVKTLVAQNALKAETITLSIIMEHLPKGESQRFSALRSEILKLDQQMKTLRESNQELLQNARDFVQFSLEAITKLALRSTNGYGSKATAPATLFLDQKC